MEDRTPFQMYTVYNWFWQNKSRELEAMVRDRNANFFATARTNQQSILAVCWTSPTARPSSHVCRTRYKPRGKRLRLFHYPLLFWNPCRGTKEARPCILRAWHLQLFSLPGRHQSTVPGRGPWQWLITTAISCAIVTIGLLAILSFASGL